MSKRQVELVVLSDLHLGTYAARARAFTAYLKSIQPQLLILNGDIIDGWQFSKRYFPASHIQAIREIFNLLSRGTRVIYITGNHDDVLRKYTDLQMGDFILTDKIVIEVNGRKTWIFHGDVFDHTTTRQARFWGRMGSNGYALLLGFNRCFNRLTQVLGKEKRSLAKAAMHQFNKRILNVTAFEQKIGALAIEKGFDTVICGHIHQPCQRVITTERGSVTYLNAGDWVEHMTALEFCDGDWKLYQYEDQPHPDISGEEARPATEVLPAEVAYYFYSLSK
ncbi:UDP-2,3-diacylglucosamine diphosphatase [Niabella terrae]